LPISPYTDAANMTTQIVLNFNSIVENAQTSTNDDKTKKAKSKDKKPVKR
jgi:hypothetical protein